MIALASSSIWPKCFTTCCLRPAALQSPIRTCSNSWSWQALHLSQGITYTTGKGSKISQSAINYASQQQRLGFSRGNVAWAVAGAAVWAVAEGPCVTARCLLALSAAVRGIEDDLLRLQGVDIKHNCISIHVLLQTQLLFKPVRCSCE